MSDDRDRRKVEQVDLGRVEEPDVEAHKKEISRSESDADERRANDEGEGPDVEGHIFEAGRSEAQRSEHGRAEMERSEHGKAEL